MRTGCLQFLRAHLGPDEVGGADVLEIGSRVVPGGGDELEVRGMMTQMGCATFTGLDMVNGENVDTVCRAEKLVAWFGAETFDVVFCGDTAEHFEDWRACFSQMKQVCKPGGIIAVVTVGPEYGRHDYPGDYWRWTGEDLTYIFADCEIFVVDPDLVGIVARKPREGFVEGDLSGIELFAVPVPEGAK